MGKLMRRRRIAHGTHLINLPFLASKVDFDGPEILDTYPIAVDFNLDGNLPDGSPEHPRNKRQSSESALNSFLQSLTNYLNNLGYSYYYRSPYMDVGYALNSNTGLGTGSTASNGAQTGMSYPTMGMGYPIGGMGYPIMGGMGYPMGGMGAYPMGGYPYGKRKKRQAGFGKLKVYLFLKNLIRVCPNEQSLLTYFYKSC